jgi:poly-beta-1,6-N-acetyl-D-glucosamine synthase
LIVVALILLGLYVLFILILYGSYTQHREDNNSVDLPEISGVTILIPIRNEAPYIIACIDSIRDNVTNTPYEILIIDDHSDDDTASLILSKSYGENVKLLTLTDGEGKKSAIHYGISQARYEVILCTDGDCIVDQNWIASHVRLLHHHHMVTGWVLPIEDEGAITQMQASDMTATIALTAVGIRDKRFYLANGANMSYRKSAYLKCNGYHEHSQVATGDDIFLIRSMAAEDYSIGFNETSIVRTHVPTVWSDFILQRRRWAAKTRTVNDKLVIMIQGFVWLFSLVMVGLYIGGMIKGNLGWVVTAIGIWMVKMGVDYIFIKAIHRRLKVEFSHSQFATSSILYLVYILWVGLYALWPSKYVWKGRSHSK